MLDEQGDPLVVDERPVLDRADARPGGELDPLAAVGVGGDEPPAGGGRLDGRLEHRPVELHATGLRPPGEHGAGGDDLDDVGPAIAQQPDDPGDVGGCPDDAGAHLRRDVDPVQAGHLAAPARSRHVRAGGLHPRPVDEAVVDCVAELEIEERAERPDVAHGREPGAQGDRRVAHPDEELASGRDPDRRDVGILEVADEVAVPVDEPGDDRVAGEVDHAHVLGHRRSSRQDRLDPAAADEQRPLGQDGAGPRVDESSGANEQQVVGHQPAA